ncbi:MAG TPA: hypothetical protein DCR40_09140 [Prolixibacteraceae bacterium]|nr:hypothetical protein [Prolixibacteraceae bacterium]
MDYKYLIVKTWVILFINLTVYAQQWQAVPLVTKTLKDLGMVGGEGCQVVQSIEIDQTDGMFLLMGTDVGGIYRSTDGGKIWKPCNIGYTPRGNAGFAIDPGNNQRALAVGANSIKNQSHGLYLTTDQGASWKQVVQEGNYDGYRGFADKVEFVKSSFDATLSYSKVAYWLNPAGGIYRSADGGSNWSKVNTQYGNSILKVNHQNGDVYAANSTGFYLSTDGGVNFTKKLAENVADMDVSMAATGQVFVSTASKLFVSVDGGSTFTQVASANLPTKVATLNVSQADPNYMVICNKINDWGGPIYYSTNGGHNWTIAQRSNTRAFMPYNDRLQKFAWHPTDKNRVWALGGDWISSSKDGGKNFAWDANGYNGILVGGFFNFNLADPNLLLVASQDYNGAFTKDNGQTWKYCNASNLGWGGFTYGAYAASANVLVTQNSPGWEQDGKLTISKNGGSTFVSTTLTCTGLDVGCGDPKDPNIIYFSNYYSKDLGNTWTGMPDCKGVLIANIYGEKEVYGANGNRVVKSVNKGENWTTVVTLNYNIADIAIDHVLNRLYIVTSGDRLFQYDSSGLKEITSLIPKDQFNAVAIQSVAVDPQDPKVVYCAGAKNVYKSDASVKRSVDAGKTWAIITPNNRTNNGIEAGDGANEVFAIRVNPLTRELWAAGSCYGIWKEAGVKGLAVSISEPASNSTAVTGTDLVIKVVATPGEQAISKVEFFNGTDKLGETNSAPYQFTWAKIPQGIHQIQAKVTDISGMTGISPPITIKVNAAWGPIEYSENFDDDLAQNWTAGSGTWMVENKQLHHSSNNGIDLNIYDATTFFNFSFTAKIQPVWDNNYGVVFNYSDSKNYYRIELDAKPLTAIIYEVKEGAEKKLGETTYTDGGAGVYSTIKVTNDGRNTSVEVNDKVIFSNIATTVFPYGKIGLYAWWQPVWYDEIQVSATSSEPPVDWNALTEWETSAMMFPNPLLDGNLRVQLAKSGKNIRLEVFNLAGHKIWSDQNPEPGSFSVPSDVFPCNGSYIIRLSSEKNFYQSKILKLGNKK